MKLQNKYQLCKTDQNNNKNENIILVFFSEYKSSYIQIKMANEKFCLKWNDFESSISGAFKELRDDNDFFDLTLACEDNQVKAHKVILSACSPFFRTILRKNPHQHPLLYLKGLKYNDILSVLNFMYNGEVNVAQEELESLCCRRSQDKGADPDCTEPRTKQDYNKTC